jgi:hypothetical protein
MSQQRLTRRECTEAILMLREGLTAELERQTDQLTGEWRGEIPQEELETAVEKAIAILKSQTEQQ